MANVTQEYVLEVTSRGLKEIVREIKALRKDLGGLSKHTTAAEKGFNKVSKSAGEMDRNMKGAAHATNNATKGFSKMAQGMSGTLVPAYATVAANVFALTAAFGALERAADTQTLVKASEELATVTGRSLTSLASDMRGITDGAISMKEALTSASIAASAGFDNRTIKELTEVARNASVALGRDMTDSLNRVFKGAVKAEPELLDELGIILRLDPAARKYAAAIGKTVQTLTTFEKQQAVVNEVIAQGQQKFSLLADVDVNPLTQLSAAFQDVVAQILKIVNVPLGPIFTFFAENTTALTAALLIFGNTVLKTAIPALAAFGEEAQAIIDKNIAKSAISAGSTEAMKEFQAELKNTEDGMVARAKVSQKLVKDIIINSSQALGDESFERLTGALDKIPDPAERLNAVMAELNRAEDELASRTDKTSESYLQRKAALEDAIGATKSAQIQNNALNGIIERQYTILNTVNQQWINFKARVDQVKSGAITGFFKGTNDGIFQLRNNYKEFTKELAKNIDQTKALGKGTAAAAKGVFLLSGAFGSLLKAVPIIGQVTLALSLLGSAFGFIINRFRDVEAIELLNDAIKDTTESAKTAEKAYIRYNKVLKDLPDTIDNVAKKTELLNNTNRATITALEELLANSDELGGFWNNLFDIFGQGALDDAKDALVAQTDALRTLGKEDYVLEFLDKWGNLNRLNTEELKLATKELIEFKKGIADTSLIASNANDLLAKSFTNLGKAIDADLAKLPKLKNYQVIMLQLENINNMADLTAISIEQLVSGFTGLSNIQAAELGIGTQVLALSRLTFEAQTAREEIERLNELIENLGSGRNFTAAERRLQTETQTAIERQQAIINSRREKSLELVKQIGIELEDQARQLREIDAAETMLANARAKSAFAASAPGITPEQRLLAIRDLSKAEQAYYNITTSRSSKRIQKFEKEISKIEEQKQALQDLIYMEAEWSGSERAKDSAQGENVALEASRQSYQEQILRSEEDIDKARRQSNEAYIKTLVEARKIYFDTIKLQRVGISQNAMLAEITEKAFTEAAIQSYDILRENGETINQFIKRQKEAIKDSAELRNTANTINFGSTAQSAQRIDDQINYIDTLAETYNLEQQYGWKLNERIDTEHILAATSQQRAIDYLENQRNIIMSTGVITRLEAIRLARYDQWIEALKIEKALSEQSGIAKRYLSLEREVQAIEEKIKLEKINIRYGAQRNKLEENLYQIELKRRSLRSAGYSTAEIDRVIKKMQELQKYEFKFELQVDVQDALNEISELPIIFDEMRANIALATEDTEKWQAAWLGAVEISKEFGNEQLQGLSEMGLVISKFADDLSRFFGGEWIDIMGAATDAAMGFGSALMNAAEEGSAAAKAGAVIHGIGAVIKAWGAAPFPWNLPGVAITIANVASLLSQMGESANLGSAAGSGEANVQAYQDSFGDNRITGNNLQTNALGDSLDNLATISDALYGSQVELRKSIVSLKNSFDAIGKQTFNVGGSFDAGDLSTNFGVSFGTEVDSGFFRAVTTTEELLASGLELGSTIKFVAGDFATKVTDASLFITKQITESDPGFFGFGADTDVDIKTKFFGVNDALSQALSDGLEGSFDVVKNLFETFGLNIKDYFDGYELELDTSQLNLSGLSATEQAEVLSAYFSGVVNEVLKDTVPWLEKYRKAGEEVIDTLIRLTENSIILNDSLAILRTSVQDLASPEADTSRSAYRTYKQLRREELDFLNDQQDSIKLLNKKLTGNIILSREGMINLVKEFDLTANTSKKATAKIVEILAGVGRHLDAKLDLTEFKAIRDYYIDYLNDIGKTIKNDTKLTYARFQKRVLDEATAAWITSLEEVTGWTAEQFGQAFTTFAEAVFPEDVIQSNLEKNARKAVRQNKNLLKGYLEDAFPDLYTELLKVKPADIDTRFIVGDIYEQLEAAGAFADETGQEMLHLLINMGLGFDQLLDVTDDAAKNFDDLIQSLTRSIALFGLTGKELDLLQHSFDFADALEEAEGSAEAIALTEQLYGLKRLEIIKGYHEEIVDALKEAYAGVDDAILNVIRGSEAFNEVAYESLKIESIKARLLKSFKTGSFLNDQEAFSEAMEALSNIDTSASENFNETLETFLNFSEEVPGTIAEQIDLANELKDSIMDRYAAEEASLDSLKQLSLDIKSFLDDLLVGELSPLTNLQRFNELYDRFNQDIIDITSGDQEAAQRAADGILDNASALLDLGSSLFAIGPRYQDLFRDVFTQLNAVGIDLEEKVVSETEILSQLQETTIKELYAVESILGILEAKETELFEQEIRDSAVQSAEQLVAISAKLDTLPDYTNILNIIESNTRALGGIVSRDIGAVDVPFDQLALIHQGEMIIPTEQAQMIREGNVTLGATNEGTTTLETSDIVNAIHVLTQVVAETQEELIDQNGKSINTTNNILNNNSRGTTIKTVGMV